MNTVSEWIAKGWGSAADRLPAMRPSYPAVAVEIGPEAAVLARVRRKRGGACELEAHHERTLPDVGNGAGAFRPALGGTEEVAERVRALLEASGTKPGRISVLIPDSLAKVSIVHLPVRPPTRKQLEEILRFRLRRTLPFRLEEAALSYQVLPGAPEGVDLLVVVVRKAVVEQYEAVLSAAGARPGLVDLCTPNLFNLARSRMGELDAQGGDVGLLNCAPGYFSFLVTRAGRLIFYRCKPLAGLDSEGEDPDELLWRELASSLAYHREKLEGAVLSTVLVRTVTRPMEEVFERLRGFGVDHVEAVDPTRALVLPQGVRIDPAVAQRIAPAVGAAMGRG